MIFLDTLTNHSTSTASLSIRRRWPDSFPDEASAVAQGIALLKQRPGMVGFIVFPDLGQSNDTHMHERTITRAIAARKARQQRKQQGGNHDHC